MNPYLFLGLGNPGQNYERTRHNAGWLALDALIKEWENPSVPTRWKTEKKLQSEVAKLNHDGKDCFFLKPNTFMNDSGLAAAAAARWFLHQDPREENLEYRNIVVLHDDLDLPVGKYKLQYQSGPKAHNGVNSVRSHLHSEKFWIARLGVDGRAGDRSLPGQAYVLQNFPPQELQALHEALHTLAEEIRYTVLG